MKFGLNIDSQQQGNNDLHYVDYKLLKQRIKDVVARLEDGELSAALTSNTTFEEDLASEIAQVNACFEIRQKNLLEQIAELSEELAHKGDLKIVPAEQQDGAFRRLVEMLQEMSRLRKYAVWNAVAIVKVLKKRRKQTRFGIEDSSIERAGWLSRQNFFSGSEFAELHVALESLGHAVVCSVCSDLGAGSKLRNQHADKGEAQQCPICLETISDVVELSCKHHFCWKCFVLGPIAFQPGEYKMTQCPICRQDAVPSRQLTDKNDLASSTQMPSSEGALSRFLHTYFGSDMASEVQAAVEENPLEPDNDALDIVGQLVKVVLADSTWQRSAEVDKPSDSTQKSLVVSADASHGDEMTTSPAFAPVSVPSDFFETLPPKPTQDDRAQIYRAQKLQWIQIASSNDPLAFEASTFCPLCSEPLLMETVVTTPCKHHMHQICLRRLETPVCPLCPTELPFSWFLPQDHPLCDRGFKTVIASEYNPRFPGGPDRKCCGYPLHQPPPTVLRGSGGVSMRSYLHRAPPMGGNDDDDCLEVPPMEVTLPSIVDNADDVSESGASTGSESSSDDSNSRYSDDREEKDEEEAVSATPWPGGNPKCQQQAPWAYTALGRIRLAQPQAIGLHISPGGEQNGVQFQ